MAILWDQAGSLIMSSDKANEYVIQFDLQWQFPYHTVHAIFKHDADKIRNGFIQVLPLMDIRIDES